jgi:hypothetical protein
MLRVALLPARAPKTGIPCRQTQAWKEARPGRFSDRVAVRSERAPRASLRLCPVCRLGESRGVLPNHNDVTAYRNQKRAGCTPNNRMPQKAYTR